MGIRIVWAPGKECEKIDNKVKSESNNIVGSMSSFGDTIIYLYTLLLLS